MTMVHAVSKRSIHFALYFVCFVFNLKVSAQDHKPVVTTKGELGKSANITCEVHNVTEANKSNATATWEFNGIRLNLTERMKTVNETVDHDKDKDGFILKTIKYTLTITNTSLADAGVYVCSYEGERANASLDLSFEGKLLEKNDNVYVNFLEAKNNKSLREVHLFCIFEVYNTNTVYWYKLGAENKQEENATVINERTIRSNYTFTINHPDDDNGEYICEVYDSVANKTIQGSTTITICDTPNITITEVVPISDTELFVNWTIHERNSKIISYNLWFNKTPDFIEMFRLSAPNVTFQILNNLNKSTAYIVKLTFVYKPCRSNNQTYPLDAFALHAVTTLDEKPNFVPEISIKGFSSTSVTIGWDSPPSKIAYLIHYYELEGQNINNNKTKKAYHASDNRNLPYMFDDLEPHSTYSFKVRACSDYTNSCWNWSKPTEAATLDGLPVKPSNVHLYCGDRQLNVTWEPPLKPNGEIKGYQLELTGTASYKDPLGNLCSDSWGPLSKFQTSDARSALFTSLPPNTNITVHLSAYTRTRKRGEVFSATCRTEQDRPDQPPRPEWKKVQMKDGKYVFQTYMLRVSERNGPICCYRVYMIRLPPQTRWGDVPEAKRLNVVSYMEAHQTNILAAYITDVFTNDNFPSYEKDHQLIMGDEKSINTTFSNSNCSRCDMLPNQEVTTTTTSTTTMLPVTTKASRRRRDLEEVEVSTDITGRGWNPVDGPLDSNSNYTLFVELIPAQSDKEPMYSEYLHMLMPAPSAELIRPPTTLELALKVTCVCAALALLGTLIICVVNAHRSRKHPHAHQEHPLNPLNVLKKYRRAPVVTTTPPDLPPIAKDSLPAAYAERHANSDWGFQEEFEMLPEYWADRTTHASEARENQPKNRYPDIKAYDQTRVKLSQIDSITGSDYINANYVMGYQDRKQFICAQGPTETTVNDFWRMIWEHGLEMIVMLTNLEEYSKVKCSKYWPDELRGSKAFGNITVNHVSEKRYSDYIVRELKITKQAINIDGQPIYENNGFLNRNGDCKDAEEGESTSPKDSKNSEERIVKQYHFLMWKDFAAPEHPQCILKFIKRVNEARLGLTCGTVVVHCSAGVGRTGTLVALDCLLDQLRDTSHVFVFNTIAELRRQRNFLVQSLKQYVFVYRALVEYTHYGDTEIPASRLRASVDRLRNTPEGADKCLMDHEFEKILNSPVVESVKSCAAGAADDLRAKNRTTECLPYDRNRVMLTPIPGKEYSTYINASFIEAYDNSEGFIITQDPLPNTIPDFWRMVSEHNVHTIVMLSELGEGKCPRYWEDGTAQYEHISVQYEESESCPYYTRRQFRVTNNKNGDVSVVRQLQYQGWPTAPGHVPEVTRGLNELVDAALPAGVGVDLAARPMVVHCACGTERSALFVALCVLVGALRAERRVDVSAVARKVRDQRAGTLNTPTQYEFLYRAILNYAELHNLQEDS